MKKLYYVLPLFFSLLLAGCMGAVENTEKKVEAEPEATYDATLADSLDEAIVICKDTAKRTIQLENIETGKTYTLSYTGATNILDRNGEQLVMDQLTEGSLVTITFLREDKAAKAIYIRQDASSYEGVTTFEINSAAHTMNFGGYQYQLDANAAVVSDGKKLEFMDINSQDTLTVNAVDHTVYSIQISKGHGYLRLANGEFFTGGWIEVGQNVIKPVTEGMLLTVPEGTYTMLISNQGVSGTKEVEIKRNEETEVDVADLQAETEEAESGKLIFTITPGNATLFIDGTETDYSKEITLPYGIHQIVCQADGYATLTQYIKVNQEMANINVEMEEGSSVSGNQLDTDNSVNSVSQNTASASSDYKVYIDAPEGAELYVDGSYIGIIPTSFTKVAGTYSVSVRKTGFQTRSYSLQIDNAEKDVTYSFSELVEQAN